ncbi:TlpA disulfide reductase family protein [uncultured Tessaracoccus sp.]|uniref:TlpA family protein disulfide reductase n=1 Tax=uncultured Tessaracoccus sp. TaxID=905023 RepID=UPI0025D1E1D8|nr:TlpA disulfide reductase family protein [uncultured Tessaracoccus sp.]
MRRRIPAVLATLLLAGCQASPVAPPPAPTPEPSPTANLTALREEYGLPDCPDTDAGAEAVGGGLPRTALPCLGSDKVVNLAGLPRTPTVVNLWAQWCGPCREESGHLREVSRRRDDVAFVGINYNDPKPDWALEFASVVGWHYPHVQDMDKTLRAELGVPGIPMTLFVDADGRIVHRHPGVLQSAEQLEQLIEEHL